MYNWSVDEKQFKKADPKAYEIWKLEQMINYGLGGKKISERLTRKHWSKLYLDSNKKRFLEFLLWPKKKSVLSKN